jgi:hypothetical protein
MNIYGRPRYLSRYSNSWRAGWTEDQIPVGGPDFPCPSRPAPRSILPLLQCLPVISWGLSGRGVVLTTHHFLATRLRIGWSLTSAFSLRLHSHVVVWPLHIYYLFIYLFMAYSKPAKFQISCRPNSKLSRFLVSRHRMPHTLVFLICKFFSVQNLRDVKYCLCLILEGFLGVTWNNIIMRIKLHKCQISARSV